MGDQAPFLTRIAQAVMGRRGARRVATVRDRWGDGGVCRKEDRELARAIEDGELVLAYQPKISLRKREIASLEALVRWDHPKRGIVLPGDFIPAAERGPMIRPLTKHVLNAAIRDQLALRRMGHDLTIFINVAACLLTDSQFIGEICSAIKGQGAHVGLEVTETSVIRDPKTAIENLHMIAGSSIPIAIDDYGAGLSSLAYLKQLPARELKIDKLFITQLTTEHRDPLIVRSTIDLAHAMEMEVVAEGIEDATALALLTVMGCDLAQGYHISKPLLMAQLVPFLERHRIGWDDGGGFSPLPLTSLTAKSG